MGMLGWLFLRPTVPKQPAPVAQQTAKVGAPVVYQTKDWLVSKHQPNANGDTLKALLGDTAATAEALDFDGNFARQYRYASKSEAPLYVIESDTLFELAWYYASAKDDETTKQLSIKHAKRAHQVTTALYGDKGVALMQQILDGKSPNTKAYPRLVLARCQEYLCQIVIKK